MMTGTLTLLLADPACRVVESPTGTWYVSGLRTDAIRECLETADSIETVKAQVPALTEDALLVNVADDSGRQVHAFRSVTGGYRCYTLERPDGGYVLTDHLRNAIASLPVEARTVPDHAIADHLLFRGPVGADALVDGISGLPQGGWLTWDLETDTRDVELIDRLPGRGHTDPAAAPAEIESTYESLLSLEGVSDDLINCYSGGVDSTLTQSLLDPAARMLNVGIDSPEYAFEMAYAREGASHFDAPFEQLELAEADVCAHLESAIDATGSPSCPFQTVLLNRAFGRHEGQQYLMAVGADSLFGNTGTKGARIADWLSPAVGSGVVRSLAGGLPDPAGGYLEWLTSLDEQLSSPVSAPDSYAQQYSTYTNPSLVADLFDDSLVGERCRAPAASVSDRVDVDASSRFARQAAWRHHLLVFGHRVGSRWRQMAITHGNTLVNPFETRSMTDCALRVPADRRFIQGPTAGRDLSTKYLLKRLLADRVPDYPTDREKGAGVLPFERYVDDGPMANVFERYDVPSFVPDGMRQDVIADSGRQGWNVLTYAIWHDRVQQNPALEPVPTTDRIEWTVPRAIQ